MTREGLRPVNRTLPTPWKPTKAQLLAARNKPVPDLVAKNLIVLFAGINPGLYTAAIGRHFSRARQPLPGPPSTAAASPRASSHPLKNPSFSTSTSASPTSSPAPLPAPMNSRPTNFAPAASASKRRSSSARPTVVAFVGIGPYRIVSGIRDARVGPPKGPPSAAGTPGSSPTPAASTPTTSPPPSHNSSETSASGPLHSTGVDEIPAGHRCIRRARYRGSPVGLEVQS